MDNHDVSTVALSEYFTFGRRIIRLWRDWSNRAETDHSGGSEVSPIVGEALVENEGERSVTAGKWPSSVTPAVPARSDQGIAWLMYASDRGWEDYDWNTKSTDWALPLDQHAET